MEHTVGYLSQSPSRMLVAGFVVLVAVLSSISSARAAGNSVEVVVLVPAGTFHVGDAVTVTIHVYNLGIATDPGNLIVGVSGAGAYRSLTATRQGVGTFTSTFQIQSGDAAGWTDGGTIDAVPVEANATVGGNVGYGTGYVLVSSSPPLQVVLSAAPSSVLPGANVSVNATVTASGVFVDPDSLQVLASIGTTVNNVAIPMARVATGRYSGTYHTPANTPEDSLLVLTGSASLGSLTVYAWSQDVTVGHPRPFAVWQHIRSLSDSYALVDIVVANETAWPVAEANVSLFYPTGQCTGSGCQSPRWLYGTTDRLGAASFNLTYPNLQGWVVEPFRGYITMGDRNQTFSGVVFSPQMYGPYRSLCPSDGLRSYAPGEVVHRTYHGDCSYGGANETFYYAAYTPHAVIANGSVRADAQGDFNLSFTAPSDDVRVDILQNISNRGWARYFDTVWVADPSRIQIANLSIGRVAQITLDLTNVSGSVQFAPYNASNVANPLISDWAPLSGCLLPCAIPAVPGAPFRASLILPRVLPKDRDYLLEVTANATLVTPGYVYSEVVHMTDAPPTAAATFSTRNPVVGETVTADASGSSDPDGLVVAYRMDWGDGNSTDWMPGPQATHGYARPGEYTATVQVRDDSGATNTTSYSVTVDPSILGLRQSTFFLGVAIVAVALVAVVAIAVWLRRARRAREETRPPEGASQVSESQEAELGKGKPPRAG